MTFERHKPHFLHRLWGMMVLAGLMASCAVPPAANKGPAAPAPALVQPTKPPEVVVAEPAPPVVVPITVTPATILVAQRLASGAVELLEGGNEEQATAELQRALQNDPNNKLAQSLLKQIQADPVATLGREHFLYRVPAGESISRIAQRFLGDVYQFYILARYNDLRVPRQLQSGQMIKVPGKAPLPSSAPQPTPSGRAQSAGAATAPAEPAQAVPPANTATLAPVVDPAKVAERERAGKVAAATKSARSAYARQDLVSAIRHWDAVLELDPGNNTAKIERQRAVDLKAKLDRLK